MNRSKLIEKETAHVGLPEPKSHKMGLQVIRQYIREQEKNDDDRDQKKLF